MCPGVELGLCCKKFVVMDGKFVMSNQIHPFLSFLYYVFSY